VGKVGGGLGRFAEKREKNRWLSRQNDGKKIMTGGTRGDIRKQVQKKEESKNAGPRGGGDRFQQHGGIKRRGGTIIVIV